MTDEEVQAKAKLDEIARSGGVDPELIKAELMKSAQADQQRAARFQRTMMLTNCVMPIVLQFSFDPVMAVESLIACAIGIHQDNKGSLENLMQAVATAFAERERVIAEQSKARAQAEEPKPLLEVVSH